jgi:hypothetical protein
VWETEDSVQGCTWVSDGREGFDAEGFTLGEATLEHEDFCDAAAFLVWVEGDRVFHCCAAAS